MSLLAIPGRETHAADPCWCCVPGSDGPPCPKHAVEIREAATAQAQPGYGLPYICGACDQPRLPLQRHDCPAVRDEAAAIRLADL